MTGSFDHPALLYATRQEYLGGTVPFVQAGLAAGEPVLVAVPAPNLELIRTALGPDAERVRLRDMTDAGRNPGRIIPGVLVAFAEEHAGRRVHIIGEPIWPGRTTLEYPACAQHEALINTAFEGRDAAILCPYDVAELDSDAVEDAYRTHPTMVTPDRRWDSPHYDDPIAAAAQFNRPLPTPPPDAVTFLIDFGGLAAVRHFTREQAEKRGLPKDRVEDLILAVSELAANTLHHTQAPGALAIWTEDGYLACQLSDTGHITNPMAGRLVVPDTALGGRGLLLVNQLCDLVRVYSTPAGTTIRLHMYLN